MSRPRGPLPARSPASTRGASSHGPASSRGGLARRSAPPPPSSRRRRPPVPRGSPYGVPDVRDGLTSLERIVLRTLDEVQREFPGRSVPTSTLYGRVVERVDVSEPEFLRVLTRLVGTKSG